QSFVVDAQIVTSGRFDILMTGEFLDVHDVCTAVEESRAKSVPEHMRRQTFFDAAVAPELGEQFRHVVPRQAPRAKPRCYEQGRVCVVSDLKIAVYPPKALLGKENRPRLIALADDVGLFGESVDRFPVERERFRYPHAC